MTCSKPSLCAPAVPDSFAPHPNLSDEINLHIIESEIEGGVHLDRLLPGEVLEIETRDWICRMEYRGDHRAAVSGHSRFCPEPVEVDVCGSTWGGSLLKQHFIGRGMHLEIIHPRHQRILTSRILEIRAVAA